MKPGAVIFDMDGTILDTLEDLTAALNFSMAAAGHRHDFPPETVRFFFGSGARTAVSRALRAERHMPDDLSALFHAAPSSPELDAETHRVLEIFREYYPAHSALGTQPYDGIPELLALLRANGVRTAVVSNKLDQAVRSLADQYFPKLLDAAIGEQEPVMRRKPAPDMVLAALDRLAVPARNAVYVGDSEIDLETARNTGLRCVCVSWGFRDRNFLERLQPEIIVDRVPELASLLLSNSI